VNTTIIEAVRVWAEDGTATEYPWDPKTWYTVRDDCPYLDIRTSGHPARAAHGYSIGPLPDVCDDGTRWQRWDLSEELSRKRRLGEISLVLKVPKSCELRCYVVPTALLTYRDVVTMVEDVEAEMEFAAAWDLVADRPDRSWSRPLPQSRSCSPAEILNMVDEEIRAASAIRRDPFTELAPASRLGTPLAENAIVSQWAMRRASQLRDLEERLSASLKAATRRKVLHNPEKRQERIDAEVVRLGAILSRSSESKAILAHYVSDLELGTQIYPSPLFQRDHRLRLLLRVFAPSASEAIAETESVRSSYPPLVLNHLWELWGIVWIARQLRSLGFEGPCSVEAVETVTRCAWRLARGVVTVELDFEAEPVLVEYHRLPPLQERKMPALEWAACHQQLDEDRPFLGTEAKCSPDYLIRFTTPAGKTLLVGDACLSSPLHHGGSGDKLGSKPYTVERYRRTIAWVSGNDVVRCHPMGGFVLFPPPSEAWHEFTTLQGASDCMLLCPGPQDDAEASRRFWILLETVVPGLVAPASAEAAHCTDAGQQLTFSH
jgi:hypothetical protein